MADEGAGLTATKIFTKSTAPGTWQLRYHFWGAQVVKGVSDHSQIHPAIPSLWREPGPKPQRQPARPIREVWPLFFSIESFHQICM